MPGTGRPVFSLKGDAKYGKQEESRATPRSLQAPLCADRGRLWIYTCQATRERPEVHLCEMWPRGSREQQSLRCTQALEANLKSDRPRGGEMAWSSQSAPVAARLPRECLSLGHGLLSYRPAADGSSATRLRRCRSASGWRAALPATVHRILGDTRSGIGRRRYVAGVGRLTCRRCRCSRYHRA